MICVPYHTDITMTEYQISNKSLAIQSTPLSDLQLYVEVNSVMLELLPLGEIRKEQMLLIHPQRSYSEQY
jgi:hypothetical protein